MDPEIPSRPHLTAIRRVIIEIGFIVFFFYSNLLMGQFTESSGQGKTLGVALVDIFSLTNFAIGLVCALFGCLVFEYLRKKI